MKKIKLPQNISLSNIFNCCEIINHQNCVVVDPTAMRVLLMSMTLVLLVNKL